MSTMVGHSMQIVPFNIQDRLAQALAQRYKSMFATVIVEAGKVAKRHGYHAEKVESGIALVADGDPHSLIRELAALTGVKGPEASAMRVLLNMQFVAEQLTFFSAFMKELDVRTAQSLMSMSLDKDKAFADKLDGIRKYYLDDAVKRIAGEEDLLKKSFLQKLVDWAEGRAKYLNVSELVGEMEDASEARAYFFARDQLTRFNKAVTLASFDAAEVPYIEVLTAGDVRVRPSHREWQHAIFTPGGLVSDPRYEDYNCRCGFVPRYELTLEQRARLVA